MLIVADIEANGLLKPTATKKAATLIHCLCIHVVEINQAYAFADHPGYRPMREGLELLDAADFIIGHCFRVYDMPMLKKFQNHTVDPRKLLDTHDMCKLWLDLDRIAQYDKTLIAEGRMPSECARRLSLESWGYRLDQHKIHHDDWENFSDAMVQRCLGDLKVNLALYAMLEPLGETI